MGEASREIVFDNSETKQNGASEFTEEDIQQVLADFQTLDMENDQCEDASDLVNYNKGWKANPVDRIANYYRTNKNIFIFNYVIFNKRKEILKILGEKVALEKQEEFRKRFGRYMLRVEEGKDDAKDLLRGDTPAAVFDGCYWPCEKAGRVVNHHDNLYVNGTNPEGLEIKQLFSEKTKKMEKSNSELKRVGVFGRNGKRLVTIEKTKEGKRNYIFNDEANCNLEVHSTVKDENGKEVDCVILGTLNSGKIAFTIVKPENFKFSAIAVEQNELLINGAPLNTIIQALE